MASELELIERMDACITEHALGCRCPDGCEDPKYCTLQGKCAHLDLSLIEAQVAASRIGDGE